MQFSIYKSLDFYSFSIINIWIFITEFWHKRHPIKLAFSKFSIDTPAANVITRVSHYTLTHMSTVNNLLKARFFCELLYNCASFPTNNKIMQLWNFSTANDLHYTVCNLATAIMTKHEKTRRMCIKYLNMSKINNIQILMTTKNH